MADYAWPAPADRKLIGTDILRVDAPFKVSGKAQYTTDVNLPGMLYATTVRCPYAHAKIVSIDTKSAAKSPGCKAVYVIQKPGTEIFWAGDDIVAVAAVDELSAAQAANAVKVRYKELPHLVIDSDPNAPAGFSQPMKPEAVGEVDSAFEQAAAGIDPATAADIKRRRDEVIMSEMYLRDRATREHCVDTQSFTTEMAAIE